MVRDRARVGVRVKVRVRVRVKVRVRVRPTLEQVIMSGHVVFMKWRTWYELTAAASASVSWSVDSPQHVPSGLMILASSHLLDRSPSTALSAV